MKNITIARSITILLSIAFVFACTSPEYMEEEISIRQAKDTAPSRLQLILEAESQFREVTQGRPLVIPLVNIPSPSPSVFLMPVSDNTDSLCVSRVYIVDATDTTRAFDYKRDTYLLDFVIYDVQTEETSFLAFVTGFNGQEREIPIDGFIYLDIQLINRNEYNFPSDCTVPIIRIPPQEK